MNWIKWISAGLTIAAAIKQNGWVKTRDALVGTLEEVLGVSETTTTDTDTKTK